MTKKKVF